MGCLYKKLYKMEKLTPDKIKWIGIDLDKTLAHNTGFPDYELTEPLEGAREAVEEIVAMGYKPIIYTARPWADYAIIEYWLNKYSIPFRRIVCGKMLVKYMIDDVNIEFNGDWTQTLRKMRPGTPDCDGCSG